MLDWSESGFAITGWRGEELRRGQSLDLELAIPMSGPKGRTRVRAQVTRYDPQKDIVAFAFGGIDHRTVEILSRYATD